MKRETTLSVALSRQNGPLVRGRFEIRLDGSTCRNGISEEKIGLVERAKKVQTLSTLSDPIQPNRVKTFEDVSILAVLW